VISICLSAGLFSSVSPVYFRQSRDQCLYLSDIVTVFIPVVIYLTVGPKATSLSRIHKLHGVYYRCVLSFYSACIVSMMSLALNTKKHDSIDKRSV